MTSARKRREKEARMRRVFCAGPGCEADVRVHNARQHADQTGHDVEGVLPRLRDRAVWGKHKIVTRVVVGPGRDQFGYPLDPGQERIAWVVTAPYSVDGIASTESRRTWTAALELANVRDSGGLQFLPIGWQFIEVSHDGVWVPGWHYTWRCIRCRDEGKQHTHTANPAAHSNWHYDRDGVGS